MIHYYKGSVFNSPAKTLVNAVNCVGVLGKGIALEFKLRYEGLEKEYIANCQDKSLRIGRPKLFMYSEERWILNFPTKGHWRFPSKIEWIEQSLKYFLANYKKVDIDSIAFPKLGCENGHLEWKDVKPIMEKYLSQVDLDVYICLDESNFIDGAEKFMLEKLNRTSLEELIMKVNLTQTQVGIISKAIPLKRFRYILKLDRMDRKIYEKLYRYYYDQYSGKESKGIHKNQQLSLFDTIDNFDLFDNDTTKFNNLNSSRTLTENIAIIDNKEELKNEKSEVDKSNKILVNLILEHRKQGLSYEKISKLVGVSSSTVGKVVRNNK